MSHIKPVVGGSRKRSICAYNQFRGLESTKTTVDVAYPAEIINGIEFRRQATMDAQELLVHDSSQWQCAERLHARIVNPF